MNQLVKKEGALEFPLNETTRQNWHRNIPDGST